MANTDDYSGRLSAYHRAKPRFNATVAVLCGAAAGVRERYAGMPAAFDLDLAVGVQLDAVGGWVGLDRKISTLIANVYFSHDLDELGFDQGVWQGPFDSDSGLTELDDDTYRLLLRAKIEANQWDGTLGSSAALLNRIFSSDSDPVIIQASGERFGAGDGSRLNFPLRYQGRQVDQVGNEAALYRRDWQGNQRLCPTPRTNLVTRSYMAATGWHGSYGSVLAFNVGTAPDGSTQAGRLGTTVSASNSYAYPGSSVAASYRAGTRYTASVWFKRNPAMPSKQVRLLLHSAAFSVHKEIYFDIQTGAVQPGHGSSRPQAFGSVVYPEGWTWVWVSDTAAVTVKGYPPVVWFNQNIVPGESVDFWGLQLETGATPTAYLPTEGAPVTVTDYTLDATGIARLAVAPVSGAVLTWTGSGRTFPAGTYVLMQDNGDMSIDMGVAGTLPSALFLALLTGGYFPLKPQGVRISYYVISSGEGPLFGFDVQNHYLSGFDGGFWGLLFTG